MGSCPDTDIDPHISLFFLSMINKLCELGLKPTVILDLALFKSDELPHVLKKLMVAWNGPKIYMGSRPSKVRKSPIKSASPSPCSVKKNHDRHQRQGRKLHITFFHPLRIEIPTDYS